MRVCIFVVIATVTLAVNQQAPDLYSIFLFEPANNADKLFMEKLKGNLESYKHRLNATNFLSIRDLLNLRNELDSVSKVARNSLSQVEGITAGAACNARGLVITIMDSIDVVTKATRLLRTQIP